MDLMDLYFDHPMAFYSLAALVVVLYIAHGRYRKRRITQVDVEAKASSMLTVLGPRRYEAKKDNWRCSVIASTFTSGTDGGTSRDYWALAIADSRLNDLADVRIEKAGLLQKLPGAETFLEIDVVTTGDASFDDVDRIIRNTPSENDADVVRFCIPQVLRAVEKLFEHPTFFPLQLSPGKLNASLAVKWNVEKGSNGAKALLNLAAALDAALGAEPKNALAAEPASVSVTEE